VSLPWVFGWVMGRVKPEGGSMRLVWGGKEICGPGAVVPLIREDALIAVDKLVQVS